MEWQRDYEADVSTLTGQTEPVPMLHIQLSSWTRQYSATSQIPIMQLKASTENPRNLVLVGPKYMLHHVDGTHLGNTDYRHMGEYFARVYRHVVLEGGAWEPLRPVGAKRSGSVIRVRFHVPEPPLVFDTQLVANPGNYGFEFWDNSGSVPAIKAVELEDEDTVRITLARIPTGTVQYVRYAYTGSPGAYGGPASGPRGNLRDSDITPSRFANRLYNWAVHSEQLVR